MGNSINRSANQSTNDNQPPEQRIQFSTSLLSLSNFTSKHFSRSRRSYSVSIVDRSSHETNDSKPLHQVIDKKKNNYLFNKTTSENI